MLVDGTVVEGPFGEFVGYLSPADQAPVFEITAVTHRDRPIYHAINGYGRETIMQAWRRTTSTSAGAMNTST